MYNLRGEKPMTPDIENALRSTAKKVIKEIRSPGNTLTYRQLLDKHIDPIKQILPNSPAPYLWLSCYCIKVQNET